MPPHSKCHFTRNCLVILYFNSGSIISRFMLPFMFTRDSPEHFLESGTNNSNRTARNKVSGKIPPLATCQFIRKYKGIRHFRSDGIVWGSIRNCCAVDKSGVLVSSWSAVSNNFYHHSPHETDQSTSCKAC